MTVALSISQFCHITINNTFIVTGGSSAQHNESGYMITLHNVICCRGQVKLIHNIVVGHQHALLPYGADIGVKLNCGKIDYDEKAPIRVPMYIDAT